MVVTKRLNFIFTKLTIYLLVRCTDTDEIKSTKTILLKFQSRYSQNTKIQTYKQSLFVNKFEPTANELIYYYFREF